MAVSPDTLILNFEQEVRDFEKMFDKILSTKKIYPGESVSIFPPNGFNSRHAQKIKEIYVGAGWKDVVYTDTKRDGSHLEFKSEKVG